MKHFHFSLERLKIKSHKVNAFYHRTNVYVKYCVLGYEYINRSLDAYRSTLEKTNRKNKWLECDCSKRTTTKKHTHDDHSLHSFEYFYDNSFHYNRTMGWRAHQAQIYTTSIRNIRKQKCTHMNQRPESIQTLPHTPREREHYTLIFKMPTAKQLIRRHIVMQTDEI